MEPKKPCANLAELLGISIASLFMNEFGTEVENNFHGKKSKISPFHRSGEKKAVDRPEFVQTL